MKEHGMLFKGEMIRAILDGTKTQTRRVIKPQPTHLGDGLMEWRGRNGAEPFAMTDACPHGIPSDRLWVREAIWHQQIMVEPHYPGTYQCGEFVENPPWMEYADPWMFEPSKPGDPSTEGLGDAISDHIRYCATDDDPTQEGDERASWVKRPSIHMPRFASRLTLSIKDVRVERVQDISSDDAAEEGIRYAAGSYELEWMTPVARERQRIRDFHKLWNAINVKRGYGWDVNPWVWVVSFEKIKG